MKYMMPDEIYQVCKWLACLFLPALAVMISRIGPAWNMPNVDAIVLTINAVAAFLGACIGISQLTAKEDVNGNR